MKPKGRKEKYQRYKKIKGKTSVKFRWPTFTLKIITYTMRIGKRKKTLEYPEKDIQHILNIK